MRDNMRNTEQLQTQIQQRIKVLEYSIKVTTSLSTKIHLEAELDKLKSSI